MNLRTVKRAKTGLLQEAYHLISEGLIECLSLDLFDTLLWRTLPTPADLFILLGQKLFEERWLIPSVVPPNFPELRLLAESRARQEKYFAQGINEVSLYEVYGHMIPLFHRLSLQEMLQGSRRGVYETDVAAVVACEIAIEKEYLVLDLDLFSLVSYAHQAAGVRVILVSDTYFIEQQLQELIEESCRPHGTSLLSSITAIYASCEWGLSKREGLFDQIIEVRGVETSRILHIGDHEECDKKTALAQGYRALHYTPLTKPFSEVLDREWVEDIHKRSLLLDRKQGDFGVTTLRKRIGSLYALPAGIKKEERFYWEYGATILGPVLWGFSYWVYQRCQELGARRVYCLMREGSLYARLIDYVTPYLPYPALRAEPIWVSRLFMLHASLTTGHIQELLQIIGAFVEYCTVERFCHYIGLDIHSMGTWERYRHTMLEDKSLRKDLATSIWKHPVWKERVVAHAAAKRKRFLSYLTGIIDLTTEDRIVLVDIGWSGSTQGALQKILRQMGYSTSIHGLYMGTTHTANTALLQGDIREGYLFQGGYPQNGEAHKKGCFVIEQTATAATGLGTLQDIDGRGGIITSECTIPYQQKREAEITQEGIKAFFDLMGSYIQIGAIAWDAHSPQLQQQLRMILLRSMVNSTAREADHFGHWYHEHGPYRHLTQLIGKDPYYEHYIKDMFPLAAFQESQLHWIPAYTARHSKYLTRAAQAVWLNEVPAQCFLSEDQFPLRIFVDRGSDFSGRPFRSIYLRSNPNRQFYAATDLFFAKKPLHRIQLVLIFPESMVRISSLRMIAYDRSSPTPESITLFERESFPEETIECRAQQQIDRNTFYSRDHVQLIYRFSLSSVYHLRIRLCCEMFKMSASCKI